MSEMIGRSLCRAELGIITNNKNSLRSQLVHLKDRIPHTHKSSVVYHAPCAGQPNSPCSARYVGETERAMNVRFKEHYNWMKLLDSDEYTSPIVKHARTSGHHFRPDDITYLAKEGNKIARGIKEAIYTHALDPPLNRGGGLRHYLPHIYDTVLSTTVRPPSLHPPVSLTFPLLPQASMNRGPGAAPSVPAATFNASPLSIQPLQRLRPPRALRWQTNLHPNQNATLDAHPRNQWPLTPCLPPSPKLLTNPTRPAHKMTTQA
jgi:hypothetical protein